MTFSQTEYTRILNPIEFRSEIDQILALLFKNGISKVTLLFGCGWGNEYKDWMPFDVLTTEIIKEVQDAEELGVGLLGNDDLFITLPTLESEILLCHERDIHLSFNLNNSLVADIVAGWQSRGLMRANSTTPAKS